MGLYEKLRTHCVEATAIVFAGNPLYAMLETYGRHLSNEVSLHAREIATGLSYFGMGIAYAKGRDLSQRVFGITDKTREAVTVAHDIGFCFVLNTLINIPFYYQAGTHDIKKLLADSVVIGAAGVPIGVAASYVLDVARDIAGIKESHRTPQWLKNNNAKKLFLPALVATSIAATAGVYALRSSTTPAPEQHKQVVELSAKP